MEGFLTIFLILLFIVNLFAMFATLDIIDNIKDNGLQIKHLFLVFIFPGFLVGLPLYGSIFLIEWLIEKDFWNYPLIKKTRKG